MFWLDVDLPTQTATLHRGECIHIEPKATDRRGVNEMRAEGGWFSFESAGEAMRFHKTKRLSGDVKTCLLCRPLDHLEDVAMAGLDISTPRTGCEACATKVEVLDTKSSYRRLLDRLLGSK
ncbi:MAG: hypothetical protein NTV61_04540 [Candidatus Bathyarchaeota archaeon]|nr:hypothetical protein [Candidatus Bathyarchaeota archaeon]